MIEPQKIKRGEELSLESVIIDDTIIVDETIVKNEEKIKSNLDSQKNEEEARAFRVNYLIKKNKKRIMLL